MPKISPSFSTNEPVLATDLTTSRKGEAAQLELLRVDLKRLAKTTKRNVVSADFPTLLGTKRVQREAERLGLSLDLRDDFLGVLRLILKNRAEEEDRAVKTERSPPGLLDNWAKFRVADPALALLGLAPATASKGLEDRRVEAAKSRGRAKPVTAKTIKNYNHEPVILEEVALLLATDERLPTNEGAPVTLEVFRRQAQPDFDEATRGLSKSEVRRLAIEYVHSYREFLSELQGLAGSVRPWSSEAKILNAIGRRLGLPESQQLKEEDFMQFDDEPLEDERFFPSLHAYADRRLDNEFLVHFAVALNLSEEDTPRSRFGWLARVLEVLHFHLIAFSPRGWALLHHAAERAAGNFHVFLETMESTKYGRERLRVWAEDFQPQSRKPLKLSHAHFVWLSGLRAAELLIAPLELSEAERKAMVQWVFNNAEEEDANAIAKRLHSANKPAWVLDECSTDIAFLKACAS